MLHSPIIWVRNIIYDLSVRIEFDKKKRNERDGYQAIETDHHQLIGRCGNSLPFA